jgi:hypothetical protein
VRVAQKRKENKRKMKTIKIFGKSVPLLAIMLISVLAVSIVFAGYSIWTYTYTATVLEPIEVVRLKDLPATIYPGMGTCAIYLIHNKGDAPLTITVTMNAPVGTEYAGFSLEMAGSCGNFLIDQPNGRILHSDVDGSYTTYIFTIGTYDYKGNSDERYAYGFDLPGTYGWPTIDLSGGEVYEAAKGDSSFVKVFAGFKVLDDYDPTVPIVLNVEVLRG